jgi:hypothetical protein
MRDYDTTGRTDTRDGFRRLGNWLKRRPMESWAFFAAGIVIARVLF